MKVAVIGIGKMGAFHAKILNAMDRVELTTLVETRPERRAEAAERFQVPTEDDYQKLPDLDAVIVASPTASHLEIGSYFLSRGCSVLVEKPIAATVAEADELIDAAAKGGACLQVGHVERFNPAVMALQETVHEPLFVESERISPFSFRSMDIGVVLDLMIHDIDIILHLVDAEIEQVQAAGFGIMTRSEDVANARITFVNGCIADVTASRLSDKTVRKIRVFSRKGYVSMDYVSREAVLFKPTDKLLAEDFDPSQVDLSAVKEPKDAVFPDLLSVTPIPMGDHDPLTAQMEAFLRAVREKSEPLVPGAHGRRALAAATLIIEKIKSRSQSWKR